MCCEAHPERSSRDRSADRFSLIFIKTIIGVYYFRINYTIMKRITSIIILLLAVIALSAQDITGTWSGDLSYTDGMGQAATITVKFKISAADNGYTSTLDSPDQNAYDMAVDTTFFKESTLTVKAADYNNLEYVGTLVDKTTIDGTHTQAGMPLELNLKKETE